MDGLLSIAQTVPKPLLSYLLPFPERSIALVKRLVHQRAEIDPNLPHANKVLLKVAHAFLYTWMDFFQSNCAQAVAIFLLPYSRTFNCTSKTGWFTKGLKLIPTCPTLTKVLLQGSTHSYIWMDFFQSHQTVPSRLSYLLPYSRTFNCTSKTTGSPKELKLIPTCPANKVCPVARILIYMDGLLSVAPNCAKPFLTFFHIPERSIALVKRLAGSQKS
jgi:hypothetical protein